MNFILFVAILAFLATFHLTAAANSIAITYQDIKNGLDFKSEGDVVNDGEYFYFGGYTNFNQTTKIYFDATVDPACTTSHAYITIYSDTLPPTDSSTYSAPKTQEFHSVGKSLSVATDFPTLSGSLLNARFFYVNTGYCTFHVKAHTETN